MNNLQSVQSEREVLVNRCKEFANALKDSPEYKRYIQSREVFRNDEKAKELLREYNSAMNEFNRKSRSGTDVYEDYQTVEILRERIEQNSTLKNYFDAQDRLTNLLRETNSYLTEKLGFNFASLAKPATSCCS